MRLTILGITIREILGITIADYKSGITIADYKSGITIWELQFRELQFGNYNSGNYNLGITIADYKSGITVSNEELFLLALKYLIFLCTKTN